MDLSSVTYPAIPIADGWDDDTKRFAEAINWQNERLAVMGAQVAAMYEMFETLKPLIGGLPIMPKGLVVPGGVKRT